jgi:Cys-rich four helix bundle protein (predicted Tat secretion target)
MNRRDLFSTSAALALASAASSAMAEDHSHHDHAAMMGGAPSKALLTSLADCINKGQACLAHCLVLLGDGAKEMAPCAQSVSQMLAICTALQSLANQHAPLTKATARVALDACEQCEKECLKHAKKHVECDVCAKACVDCAKQCKALLA